MKQVHSLDGPQVPCLEHELGQFCARASAVRLASRSRSSSSIDGAAAGPRWCRLMMAKDRPCQACRGKGAERGAQLSFYVMESVGVAAVGGARKG